MDYHSKNRIPRILLAVLATITVGITIAVWAATRTVNDKGYHHPVPQRLPLTEHVEEFAEALEPGGPYREPTARERRIAEHATSALLSGRRMGLADGQFARLGFSVRHGRDRVTGRPIALIVNPEESERAWGMYVVDMSVPVRQAIEVPHPSSDLRTEEIGLSLFRRVPGSLLMIAGAHRDAADGAADAAHSKDSVFNTVATEVAEHGLAQVQLHGFRERDSPWQDVVLSAGAGSQDLLAKLSTWRLENTGISVCLASRDDCGPLTGTENVQGSVAADYGSAFLHVEIRRSAREDDTRRQTIVDGLADTLLVYPP